MTSHNPTTHTTTDGSRHTATDPRALEADIARQREELAQTVDDLRDRLDVKSRAQERAQEVKSNAQVRVHEVKDRATTGSGKPRPDLVGAGVTAVGAAILVLAWNHRRRQTRSTAATLWRRYT